MLTLLTLLLAFPPLAQAAAERNCEESAVAYITHIASAPYRAHGEKVTARNLEQLKAEASGDGAESYETYVYRRRDSNEVYTLRLYVEEIGGICPLVEYKVSSN